MYHMHPISLSWVCRQKPGGRGSKSESLKYVKCPVTNLARCLVLSYRDEHSNTDNQLLQRIYVRSTTKIRHIGTGRIILT